MVINMNCETSETFRSHTEVSWTTSNGDERVKQILANVAREVEQTVTRPVVSAMEHDKPSLVPQGEFIAETVGHDPADHISTDNCLLGCNFHISADYLQSYAPPEIEAWASTVRKLGGLVESTYSPQTTHVLCSSQFLDAPQAALRDVKRVVTAFWLADAIKNKTMYPPLRAIHLPCPFMPPAYPLSNLLVSVSGFTGPDKVDARLLLAAVGAILTSHLTPRHTVLISTKPCGAKYENAMKWKIPVVNAQWLKDIYFGNLSALKLPINEKYLLKDDENQSENNLKLSTTDLPNIGHLFTAWKHYLKIPKDALKKSEALDDSSRMTSAMDQSISKPPKCTITGFTPRTSFDLAKKVRKLGGIVLDCISEDCSHLIAPALVCTPRFLASFNHCQYILGPEWIEASYMAENFLPESGFQLRDPANERLFGCNLLLAHEKAGKKELFKGLKFFITPSIQPRPSVIRMLIVLNGGEVVCEMPQENELIPEKDSEAGKPKPPSSIVIASPPDLQFLKQRYKNNKNVPFHSVEFVLTACLRQEINFQDFTLNNF